MAKIKKNTVIEQVGIESVAAEGKCVARSNGQVIFVPDVAPGDVVDLRIIRSRKNYLEGRAIHFHHKSNFRAEPFCVHHDFCGGCKWQHLQYDIQLKYKQQQVTDNLQRIGKIALPPVSPIIPSEKTQYYRNKLEFTFSNKRWMTSEEIQSGKELDNRALGFHMPGRFDKILPIDHCYLQAEPSNAIRLAADEYAKKHNLQYYDLVQNEGFVRNVIIRTTSIGETMVIVQFARPRMEEVEGMMNFLKDRFPDVTSWMYIINQKLNETYHDQEIVTFAGRDYIEEEMEGLRFRIGPKSFYQTNSDQAYQLYKVTRDFAELSGEEVVYDLYTGTGTIANFVAKKAKHVVGIEYVPEAIEDAKVNSDVNKVGNTSFFAGDMKDMLTEEFVKEHGQPDVIITDPPRAGMHPDVIQTILKVAPARIVYVSCNPATQARDLQMLDEMYKVTKVQPVDMFPHTHHVENVVQLKLRD